MTDQNLVSLPTFEQLNGLPITVTDAAIAMGARPLYSSNDDVDHMFDLKGQKINHFAEVWLSLAGGRFAEMQTYAWRNNQSLVNSRAVDNLHVAVVPRLSGRKYGIQYATAQERDFSLSGSLTCDDVPVLYPLDDLDSSMVNEVEQLLAAGKLQPLPDFFVRAPYFDQQLGCYVVQHDICYCYQHQAIVNMKDQQNHNHWRLCRELRAYLDQDEIQICEAPFASPLATKEQFTRDYQWVTKYGEVDVSQMMLGRFSQGRVLTKS